MKTNRVTKAAPSHLETCVNRHFEIAEDRDDPVRQNPFTGARFMPEFDSIDKQKEAARRALAAKWWFSFYGPGDLPALPIDPRERSDITYDSPLHWVFANYARSWACYEFGMEHPSFDIYARGVIASPHTPDFIRENPDLLRRFPPIPLLRLCADFVWRPRTRCR